MRNNKCLKFISYSFLVLAVVAIMVCFAAGYLSGDEVMYYISGTAGTVFFIMFMLMQVIRGSLLEDFYELCGLEKPKYKHDCSGCTFLGRHIYNGHTYDLYLHGSDIPYNTTIIARWSSSGPDYTSGLSLVETPVLREAFVRAYRLGLLDNVDQSEFRETHQEIIREADSDVHD